MQSSVPEVPARELYPVPEAGVLLGISKRKIWDLVWSGELASLWLEGRRLVPRGAIQDFIAHLPKAQPKQRGAAK